MAGCHPAPTPQAQGVPTVEAPDTLDVPYQSLVGALQYLVSATRPDIANATHWRLAKRVLKYLSGTSTLGVYYDGRIHSTPIAYSDADFVNDNNTKHIRLQFHFLEDLAADGTLTIQYINTKYSIADILTKGLAQTGFEKLREIAGITSADDLKSVTNEIAGITSADDLKSVRFVDPDDTSAPATRTRPASYKPLMKRSKRTFKAPKRFETVAAVTGSCAASPNRAVDHGGAGNKRAQNRMGRYHGR
ncbi:hypothetical protein AaE_003592 [Aphanomyces astaci]|uniref:Reverse transcriptase Ty1/copia-type domain-containing protein n=1 Tax=Aphanomyces astaci TaxID=112090 RepID=A0A6A5A6U7_APHAT|nr:hypothetical protein AaE_003592 [Aphanomyces astaci]